VACSHKGPWHCSFIRNSDAQYDLAKLVYASSNPYRGIELEIVRNGREVYGYINIKHCKFMCYDGHFHQTFLTIKTDHETKGFIIPLLEGGQRASLTDCCLQYLLQALEHNSSVTLFTVHFSETLNSTKFHYYYAQLMQ